MTLSVWRFSHLSLAIVSSLFLILASLTGIILAFDAAEDSLSNEKKVDYENINLAESIPILQANFLEITELSVDPNGLVTLIGLDEEGNNIESIVDPNTGEIIGEPRKKSEFIQWITTLHRSLFLHEIGRLFVGIVSFLLFLLSFTGILLILKRQKGIQHFFSKIRKDHVAQYYHVILGRLFLLPVIILSISGTYLSMVRFHLLPTQLPEHKITKHINADIEQIGIEEFSVFQSITFNQIHKIEFPFDTEDPEEFFILKLKDKELKINQFTGLIESEIVYPKTVILETLSWDLHTGRTNPIWAAILGISSISILFFIFSGFIVTIKRTGTKIQNKYSKENAEIIILVGSENGTTLYFANSVHQQLLKSNKKSFLTELNDYTNYPKVQHLLIFAATNGLGDPPSNASKFLKLLIKIPQSKPTQVSIIGFGSTSYADFCGFAKNITSELIKESWANLILPLHTVNERSTEDFTNWVSDWSIRTEIPLISTPAYYETHKKTLKSFQVVSKTKISEIEHTFLISLKPSRGLKFTSGDLLTIYPDGKKERFYSIGKENKNVQLLVKIHENGTGSNYLYDLKHGDKIKASLVSNSNFHIPAKKVPVALIANGTGIAPFLGMISQNSKKKEIHLFAGFRKETEILKNIKFKLEMALEKNLLTSYQLVYSRENTCQYVTDVVVPNAAFFTNLIQNNGTIMICGSLAMQLDVEKELDIIFKSNLKISLIEVKNKGQILTDCY